MVPTSAPFYVFNNHTDAETAIQSLGHAGFDVKKLSLIGKGYHSEEHPVGFYSLGDRMKAWGGIGAFWGGIWGLLLVVHGNAEDVEKVRSVLASNPVWATA